MARQRIKTEHSGAKKGKGYWGKKEEAKRISRKRRRSDSKKLVQTGAKENG